MKTAPGFSELVILALILALTAMMLHSGFMLSGYGPFALAATISLITATYSFYLLKRSKSKTGRLTTACLIVSCFLAVWITDPGTGVFLIVHLLIITATRVFFFFPGPLSAMLETGIQSVAFLCSVWTFYRTGSVFLSTWVFFLTQALLSLFHTRKNLVATSNQISSTAHEQAFNRARSQAEYALTQLTK